MDSVKHTIPENLDKSEKNCPTKLLDDLPAEHDAFGSHQRIAGAIAELVQNEEGGKALALIGSWGSGKSTVVELLRQKMSSHNDFGVFLFDAWAHEGDPLRRSFLECLIDQLLSMCWLINQEYWEKQKEKLAKRLRITTTKNFPRLTRAGLIMAIATMIAPMSLVLVSLEEKALFYGIKAWYIGGFLFLLFLLTPIFLWAIAQRCPNCRKWLATYKGKQEEGNNCEDKNNDSIDVLSLLIGGKITEDRSETYETPDPTSIEFQVIFKDALEHALQPGRQLLIVVDNLDRVGTQDALAIWATMRTFFEAHENDRRLDWSKRLWLFVPFAPDTPQRLWEDEQEKVDGDKQKEAASDEQVVKDSIERKSLADEFIEKTFQATFHVPPPVLSKWKEFFMKQMREALPGHSKDDFYAVYRLFETKGPPATRPPTPRDIKLFINKLGSYHRLRRDEIPLPIQAWYVLEVSKRIEGQDPADVLLSEDLLDSTTRDLIVEAEWEDLEWQKYLAALHFNVQIDKALEVVIGNRLKEALTQADGEEVKDLQNRVEKNGFLTVLDSVITENYRDWAEKEPPTLAKAALALKSLTVDQSKEEWKHIWRCLRIGASQAEWSELNNQVGQGLVAILEHCPEVEYQSLVEKILSGLAVPQGKENLEDQALRWVEGIVPLIRHVHQKRHGALLEDKFDVLGDLNFYIEVMCALGEREDVEQIRTYFTQQAHPDQVIPKLKSICDAGHFRERHAKAVRLLVGFDAKWSWQSLIDALTQRLSTTNNVPSEELIGYLEAMIYLEDSQAANAKNTLPQICTSGHIFHHLGQHQNETKAAALCIVPILEYLPAGNPSSQPGQASQGHTYYTSILNSPPDPLVNELAQWVIRFKKAQDLLATVNKAQNTKKFVTEILQKIIDQNEGYKQLPPRFVIDHYGELKRLHTDQDLQELVRQLVEKEKLLSEIREEPFRKELSGLYLLILQASIGHDGRAPYIQFLLGGLKTLLMDVWLEELIKERELLEIAIELVDKGSDVKLSTNFHNALLDHAKRTLSGGVSPSKFQDKWGDLLKTLEQHEKMTFLRDLRDELIGNSDKDSAQILRLYGEKLLQSDVLKEKADDVVRRWFTAMVGRMDVQELDWLKNTLEGRSQIFAACPEATRETFRRRVQDALKETRDTEIKQQLRSIGSSIGIKIDHVKAHEGKEESEEQNPIDES